MIVNFSNWHTAYNMAVVRKDGLVVSVVKPGFQSHSSVTGKYVQDLAPKHIIKEYMGKVDRAIKSGSHQLADFSFNGDHFLAVYVKADDNHVRVHWASVEDGETTRTKRLLLMSAGLSHVSSLQNSG